MRGRRSLLAGWVVCVVVGCTEPATQLVVVVDSDLAPADRVTIRAIARPDDDPDDPGAESTFDIVDTPGPATFVLPLSFGVVPPGGDSTRGVDVRVEARNASEQVTVERLARTGFVRAHTLQLPMFLAQACRGIACPDGQTCDQGVCVSAEVPPETLREVEPGAELRDAGRGRDGGTAPDASSSSCVPVPVRMWQTVPGAPVATAVQALPAPSKWALAVDAEPETLFSLATADGTPESPVVIATEGSWGLTVQPTPSGLAFVARTRSSISRVEELTVQTGGLVPGRTSLGQLASRGVGAPFGGTTVYAVDEQGSGRMEVALVRADTGAHIYAGYPSGASVSVAPRADGGLLFAASNSAGTDCVVSPISSAGSVGAPVAVPTGASGCDKVAVAELSDGRVVIVYVSGGSAFWRVLDAGLTTPGPPMTVTSAAPQRVDVWPGQGGTARAVLTDGAGAIATVLLDPSTGSSEVTVIDTAGASVDAASVRSARMGDATAITFYSPSTGAVMLTVVCEP